MMRSNAAIAFDVFEQDSPIEVRDNDGYKGIFATEDIAEDSVVFYLKGTITTQPTRYTIQMGPREHLNFPSVRRTNDDLDYCWQYLNHSCAPNGYMNTAEFTFRALRNIQAGEEITFNYLSTESEMAVPFECICGSSNCFGLIRGRNFLNRAQAEQLALGVGEDNVVTLFMPAFRRPTSSSNLRPGQ